MGLFSSSSKSSSKTYVTDYSTNISADFSSGELGSGAKNNIVATGDVYYAGMSEDLAGNFMDSVTSSANNVVNAGYDLSKQFINGSYDLSKQFINGGYDLSKQFVNGALDFVNETGKTTDKFVDSSLDMIDIVLDESNKLFNDTFGWIQKTIGSAQQQTELVSSQLAQAYNSEQATHSALKTYVLYGLVGFVAYLYFNKKK